MNNNQPTPNLYTTVDDDLYAELQELIEQRIVRVEVWEESLTDALAEESASPASSQADQQTVFDLDLYLEDGIYFELYGAACLPTPEADPLQGLTTVANHLEKLVTRGLWLVDVAVDENDALVLVLGVDNQAQLYLVVSGWLLEEWDELTDES
jgi:hypothetical protein